jgi:succinate-semialdehyde dehydrogenase/glutarate-semialdehyde dehydrogenase
VAAAAAAALTGGRQGAARRLGQDVEHLRVPVNPGVTLPDQSTPPRSPIATTNPFDGSVVAEFDAMGSAEVDRLVEQSHAAYLEWRQRPREERAAIVARAGELMLERREQLAPLLTLEMGKLTREANGEVFLAASILSYYGANGPEMLADKPLPTRKGEARLVSQPVGALLGVMPWNFPYYQVVRFAGPNLVAGNTVLLKHASNCPQSALALEQLFRDAGVPEGVYTNLFVPGREVSRIIENPLIQGASLTGSEAAGASVGEVSGRHLKKCVLELGGSDPFLVLDAEDMKHTVSAALVGRMANMGQSCISAKRMLVVDEAYDEFVAGLRDAMAALVPGDPADPATTVGPVSSEESALEILEQVQDAIDKGAKVEIGGGRMERPGAFIEPTLLTGVTPEMRIFREEVFGPVAVVHRVSSDEEAIAMANDSEFGLGGAVLCHDMERAQRVAERLDTGMVWINHPTSSSAELPFGGVKRSGFGRELSELGIHEFVNKKLIYALPADTRIQGAAG